MADLTGKVAIVVGASSGMGEATAKTYVEAGAKVVLAARSGDKLEALAGELGKNAVACATDARDKVAAAALVQPVAAYGRVDILALRSRMARVPSLASSYQYPGSRIKGAH